MDEKLNELLAIIKKTEELDKDPKKKADIRRKVMQNEQYDVISDEKAPLTIDDIKRIIPISITDDCGKTITDFSIKQYIEGVLVGIWSSAESFAEVLFSDKQTIVRCIDNNEEYTFQEPSDLIKYIEEQYLINKTDNKTETI